MKPSATRQWACRSALCNVRQYSAALVLCFDAGRCVWLCFPQVGREDSGETEADRAAGAERQGQGGPEERGAGNVQDQLHGPAHYRRLVRATLARVRG